MFLNLALTTFCNIQNILYRRVIHRETVDECFDNKQTQNRVAWHVWDFLVLNIIYN